MAFLFQFRLGSYNVGTYTLTGKGYSVSTYLPGAYQVTYITPEITGGDACGRQG